ncbi:hypothetical protein BKA69DRAFT_235312 [Paraphysoderma sedebokerense]|nr:hypothetical protein BKA69DRAFT_235312 [Paraphysoderma sedebokerense]
MKINVKFLFFALFLAQLAMIHGAPATSDVEVSDVTYAEEVAAEVNEAYDAEDVAQNDLRLGKRQARGGFGTAGRSGSQATGPQAGPEFLGRNAIFGNTFIRENFQRAGRNGGGGDGLATS